MQGMERLVSRCLSISATLIGLLSLFGEDKNILVKSALLAFLVSLTTGVCWSVSNYRLHHNLVHKVWAFPSNWHQILANLCVMALILGLGLLVANVIVYQ